MKTAYDVLGVPRKASNEGIRTAFRKAAKACHPDLNAGDPTAELQIQQVITAYEILKTPHRRAAYDRHLRQRRRERARRCAMAAVASLLPGSIVALAVSLSVWQPNTRGVSVPPLSPHMVSGKVRPDASQQVAAAADRGRQEVDMGRKSDWGATPEHGPRHRPQAAGSLPPTIGPPDLYAALAREWGLEASGEPMAFAGRARETELARSELIVPIDAAAAPSSNSLKKPSLEERATKFVSSQITGWLSTSTVASAYADNVLYYGRRKSRKAILLEKSRELERWPERVYDVQRDSMMVQCLANLCKVRGIMAWQTRNAHHATPAGGISKFEYEITPSDDGFRILSENGSVVDRYRQEDGRNQSRRIKMAAHQHRYKRRITSNESRAHEQRPGKSA
jgi:hypothetical protein